MQHVGRQYVAFNMLLVAGNMLLPATKLLPVSCPPVAVYKGIHVGCCRNTGNMLPATSNMLPGNMLPGVNAA